MNKYISNRPQSKVIYGKKGNNYLTAASYMIHMDTAWTDGLYQQTCDRIYRIGQTKPVFIYNLVCKNTIDEHVKEMVDVKRSMSDFIVDEMNPEIVHNLCSYIEDL